MSDQTPVLHEGIGQTYRRWLSCGAVASELPTPATSCKHTGQMYLHLLHVYRCRRLAAAEMLTDLQKLDPQPTHAPKTARGRYWTNSTSREQRAGDFDASRFMPIVYEAAPRTIATQPVKSDPQPIHATETALSTWKISWTDFAPRYKTRRLLGCQSRTRNTKRHSARGQLPFFAQLYSPTEINA